MKNLILSLLMFPFLFSCGQDHSQENIKLVNDYIQSVENLEFDAMSQLLADDYVGIGPSIADSTTKKNAISSWKQNAKSLYEKIAYKESRTLAVVIPDGDNKGEWVTNWAKVKIDYQDGKSVTILANTVYMIENGKIKKSYTFYNEADALEQLGYHFINPNELSL